MKINFKQKEIQDSINDYLNLGYRKWYLELDISDFGASIAHILKLPQKIYYLNPKIHLWAFLQDFLQNCKLSLIHRLDNSENNKALDNLDLALIGSWHRSQFAIPLWILDDLLLVGFEIISETDFFIIDSETIKWYPPKAIGTGKNSLQNSQTDLVIIINDVFFDKKIFFLIEDKMISITNDIYKEISFFERIAKIKIK